MKKTLKLACVTAFAVVANNDAVALDGAALFVSKQCTVCHGADAKTSSSPAYPKLAGQVESYLAQQTTDLLDGKRSGTGAMVMKAMLQGLKDAEIKAISAWIAAQPDHAVTLDPTAAGAELYAAKGCATCHGEDGDSPVVSPENGNSPKLSGQYAIYALEQMKAIRDGRRSNADASKMKAQTQGITDEELARIATWLESGG